jgi:glutathione synthase/RimK-type ligase-like ATP-grasp enzyme
LNPSVSSRFALRIATCRPLPEPDVDEDLLLAALAERGIAARMAAWNDPDENWDAPVPTLLRSTWDYIHALPAFEAWIARAAAAAPLWNPPQVLRGNLHKRYLLELAARGVPVVPTELVAQGAGGTLAERLAARGWRDVVVKPAVGAGSFETHRLADGASGAGEALLARLAATRDVLIQPYQASVEAHGERALVWIAGTFTHAVRKSPRFADGVEQVSAALPVSAAERAVGEAALAPLADQLLYARVDVAPDAAGQPQVMELELVEPSLFLLQSPLALARLADAVVERLRGIDS